jgi:cell division protein FtsB
MRLKQILIRLFLFVELTAFGYVYMCGKNGFYVLQAQKNAVAQLQQSVDQLKKEIMIIEEEIVAWETDDFYKEKVAREQLQMARKGDEIFYVGS